MGLKSQYFVPMKLKVKQKVVGQESDYIILRVQVTKKIGKNFSNCNGFGKKVEAPKK